MFCKACHETGHKKRKGWATGVIRSLGVTIMRGFQIGKHARFFAKYILVVTGVTEIEVAVRVL